MAKFPNLCKKSPNWNWITNNLQEELNFIVTKDSSHVKTKIYLGRSNGSSRFKALFSQISAKSSKIDKKVYDVINLQ